MTPSGQPDGPRLVLVPPGQDSDPRVTAVLDVLSGRTVREVAREHSVDVAVVHRWVHDFIDAGTAQVTNSPRSDDARQRDRFLAAFAHELRTPLAVAQGWANLLNEGDVPPSLAESTTAKLTEALHRLGDTVANVEMLASASLGRLKVERTPTPVSALITAIGKPVDVTGLGAQALVDVDPILFSIVLRDLWTAAELQPTPSRLHLDVETHGAQAVVSIIRTGPPVATATLQALFNPFDINDDATGVTIGLYLARALTVAHAGTLGVDQDEKSATFWVRIPQREHDTDQPNNSTATPKE